MQLDKAIQNISVIGAAGKMGRGISLVLLQEIAFREVSKTGKIGTGKYTLHLIDSDDAGLANLLPYLHDQILKIAEKNINSLRVSFENNSLLISNQEIIEAFVYGAMSIIRLDTSIEAAKKSYLIFEAIVEDVDIKIQLFEKIAHFGNNESIFLTNTSSIPIHILNERASLKNRIVGFHFYNPPAVQKLVELIIPDNTEPLVKVLANDLGKALHKTLVHSSDVAGFIGNGHFMREIVFALSKVREIAYSSTILEAIYIVNRITQDWLIRPMGIFQLIDFVGIDVCAKIGKVMQDNLPDFIFEESLIDIMISEGKLGGQYPNGSQKNGFFQYDKHELVGIYSPEVKTYFSFAEGVWSTKADFFLGKIPSEYVSWKHLLNNPKKNEILSSYFHNLLTMNSPGAELSKLFLLNSREIAQNLVRTRVAEKMEDVDLVLKNGFFHLYGADSTWLSQETETLI